MENTVCLVDHGNILGKENSTMIERDRIFLGLPYLRVKGGVYGWEEGGFYHLAREKKREAIHAEVREVRFPPTLWERRKISRLEGHTTGEAGVVMFSERERKRALGTYLNGVARGGLLEL